LLVKGGGWQTSVGDAICGCVPSDKAGTSNYWSHLWTHHRLVWYELKRRDGALNPAGEASMAKLKEGLANMAAGTQVNRGIRGEQFLSPLPVPTLTPAASASASLGSFVDFMASVAHLQAPVAAQVSRVKSEAHRYLELPAAPMNTDPLEWWAANEINFPALSVMARQYLGVPATSASAERLFSLAGRAFDDLRQCMKEEMLEILMWARINKEKRQRD
jgi:hypothetical protein